MGARFAPSGTGRDPHRARHENSDIPDMEQPLPPRADLSNSPGNKSFVERGDTGAAAISAPTSLASAPTAMPSAPAQVASRHAAGAKHSGGDLVPGATRAPTPGSDTTATFSAPVGVAAAVLPTALPAPAPVRAAEHCTSAEVRVPPPVAASQAPAAQPEEVLAAEHAVAPAPAVVPLGLLVVKEPIAPAGAVPFSRAPAPTEVSFVATPQQTRERGHRRRAALACLCGKVRTRE
mmetsp:Transcript_21941/g.56165  ORF Transcript_21941/g.56165 Transcript_21941/m.56165 type:complete len:235 (-) Transcript_21941:288-992(-)